MLLYFCEMGRFHSYLNSAVHILNQYSGQEPLASFLKKFYSQRKKYGSNDRRQISHLCYCYFRLGRYLLHVPIEERILIGLFLCSNERNEILEELKPEWNSKIDLLTDKKLFIIHYSPKESSRTLLINDVFPWKNELSEEVDHKKFCESFFIQPDLFLRIRPGN